MELKRLVSNEMAETPAGVAISILLGIIERILTDSQAQTFVERIEVVGSEASAAEIARLASECMKPEQRARFASAVDEEIRRLD